MGQHAKRADGSFLPGMTLNEIKDLLDAEPNKRNAQKMLVAYHYKSGKSVSEAAAAACTSYENARRWVGDMRRRGPDALRHRKPPGAARMLTRDERVRLVVDAYRGPRACGFKTDAWTHVLIHRHVQKKFNAKIGYRAVVYLVHKLRIVIAPPRPARPQEASRKGRAGPRQEAPGPPLVCAGRGRPLKAEKRALAPEMRGRLPPRLASSGLPYEYLANPPELLLKE